VYGSRSRFAKACPAPALFGTARSAQSPHDARSALGAASCLVITLRSLVTPSKAIVLPLFLFRGLFGLALPIVATLPLPVCKGLGVGWRLPF
jgi:hypothetical protein